MEYLSAQEAARRWGVHVRVAQSYCKDGRVPGARKCGASWLIPSAAEKPRDPRRDPRPQPAPYLGCVLLSALVPMPEGDPDAALDALPDEGQRAQYAAELAYLRGDFEAVKAHYGRTPPDAPTYLCAANIAICAAMCTRDYPLFKRISASVKAMEEGAPSSMTARLASLLPVQAAVAMNAPELAPAWLVRADFSGFPPESRPMLAFMRAKYLQSVGDQSGLLATAQTALAIYQRPGARTFADVYQTCLCACACYALGRLDDTRAYLDRAVALCEAGGFVSPLGEYSAWVGGLMERTLKKCAPDFEKAVLAHIERTLKNWLFFHNEFTRDNVSLILSPREYQLAVLLKEGKSYREAAERLCLSVGRTRNLVSVIYEKLGISRKADISRFVF